MHFIRNILIFRGRSIKWKLIGKKTLMIGYSQLLFLHNKNLVSWETMEEALLLMRKHLIVKYGQYDSQYTPPHRGVHKDSLRAQKNTHGFQ